MDTRRDAKEVGALAGDEVRRRRDRAPAAAAVRACKRGGKGGRKLCVLTTSTVVRLAWREVDEGGEGDGRARSAAGFEDEEEAVVVGAPAPRSRRRGRSGRRGRRGTR